MESQAKPLGTLKKYRKMYKEEGFKGFVQKAGWKITLGLFLFFLLKGLLHLAIWFGGIKWISSLLSES
jgi:hypothetical protein